MKYISIFSIVFALTFMLILSGCVSNNKQNINFNAPNPNLQNQDINDYNHITENDSTDTSNVNTTTTTNDQTNLQTNGQDSSTKNVNSNDKNVTHCYKDYGNGVTQEFWFADGMARLLTKGPAETGDNIITPTSNCAWSTSGHNCNDFTKEDFDNTVESWKTGAQTIADCDIIDMNYAIFRIQQIPE